MCESTGNFDALTDSEKQDLGEFGKEMFDLWTSMDDVDVGGGTVDEQDEAAAYVIQEAVFDFCFRNNVVCLIVENKLRVNEMKMFATR